MLSRVIANNIEDVFLRNSVDASQFRFSRSIFNMLLRFEIAASRRPNFAFFDNPVKLRDGGRNFPVNN